eukprot:scaffold22742_cov139-Cylindrotheca_fusiformis.AAC.10
MRAIDLNNRAIAKMRLGNYEGSIQKLSTALLCLRHVSQPAADLADLAPRMILDTLEKHFAHLLNSDGGCEESVDGTFVFTRALAIPTFAARSTTSQSLVIKVIIFNLALSHQMMACEKSGIQREHCLRKAGKLYRFCYRVRTPHRLTERFLLPALANNLGIVYFTKKETNRAVQVFHRLLAMVIGRSAYRSNSNIDCFLRNVSKALPSQYTPAAAA